MHTITISNRCSLDDESPLIELEVDQGEEIYKNLVQVNEDNSVDETAAANASTTTVTISVNVPDTNSDNDNDADAVSTISDSVDKNTKIGISLCVVYNFSLIFLLMLAIFVYHKLKKY